MTNNHRATLIGGGLLLAVLLGAVVLLATKVNAMSNDLDAALDRQNQLETDLARVEGGAALYAAQITDFQQQLTDLGPVIDSALGEAVVGIDEFKTSTITFDVNIDETVPIDAQVVLNRTIEVPINTTIPINEQFDTTITINGPFGVDIPLDITVPIALDLPIDLVVSIPVDETIPINTSVPVKLDLPISIDIAETELAALAEALAEGLDSFRQMASQLGG